MSSTSPEKTLHTRQMNINAHFAWALAMWSSAESAHKQKNTLLAAVGYYYSAFHAGFALINTNESIPAEKLVRITHSALKGYLEPLVPGAGIFHYELLQGIREAVNYLGAESPTGKLKIVRGNGFGFDIGNNVRFTFERALEMAHKQSLSFMRICLIQIEAFCSTKNIVGPKRGDSYWIDEYIDEDFLLGVIPSEGEGLSILKRAVSLLETDLASTSTPQKFTGNQESTSQDD